MKSHDSSDFSVARAVRLQTESASPRSLTTPVTTHPLRGRSGKNFPSPWAAIQGPDRAERGVAGCPAQEVQLLDGLCLWPNSQLTKDSGRMRRLKKLLRRLRTQIAGGVFVEYLLLVTLVGIGVIAGLATVRMALLNELNDLAQAINAIN